MSFVFVFLGGGVGTLIRFLISLFAQSQGLSLWKGTLFFFLCLKFLPETKINSQFLRFGIMGGLTTFSTFSFEFFHAFQQHEYATMFLILATNLLGAFSIGYLLIR